MRMTKKALTEKMKSQTDAMHLAYKKYKQGISSENEYELEIERLDTLFDASFEEKVN